MQSGAVTVRSLPRHVMPVRALASVVLSRTALGGHGLHPTEEEPEAQRSWVPLPRPHSPAEGRLHLKATVCLQRPFSFSSSNLSLSRRGGRGRSWRTRTKRRGREGRPSVEQLLESTGQVWGQERWGGKGQACQLGRTGLSTWSACLCHIVAAHGCGLVGQWGQGERLARRQSVKPHGDMLSPAARCPLWWQSRWGNLGGLQTTAGLGKVLVPSRSVTLASPAKDCPAATETFLSGPGDSGSIDLFYWICLGGGLLSLIPGPRLLSLCGLLPHAPVFCLSANESAPSGFVLGLRPLINKRFLTSTCCLCAPHGADPFRPSYTAG